jgi:asparagine synthase (glutamine-hydrolysing)
MCGIAGMLFSRGQSIDEQLLRRMGEVQRHRGPDHLGLFLKDNIGFAHTRLSILDLSPAGNQPFVNDRFVLAFNGEIYNYQEIGRQLQKQNVEIRGSSDTAVLFAALITWGTAKTLRAIRGMFAFSFCDLQSGTVYLCRDRLGIKPLVWCYCDKRLYWASEVKAIAAAKPIEPDPIKTLYATLSVADDSGFRTAFRGVRSVPPGCYLECQPGHEPVEHEYYCLADEVDKSYYQQLDRTSKSEVVRQFSELLDQSVQRMLMSDVRMGVFVSGGIDSSVIAESAARQDSSIAFFTANVTGRYSEFPDAQALSVQIGRELLDAKFTPEMLLAEWARSTWHYEFPIVRHVNALPLGVVARLAQATGVKPVLTGDGSDELFLGYPPVLAQRYRTPAVMPVELIKRAYGMIPRVREFLFPELNGSREAFISLAVQDFEAARFRERAQAAYSFLPQRQAAEHLQCLTMVQNGLVSLLHRNDRMGMMASIESRFPFLDEDLVHFAANLPVKFKIRAVPRFYNPMHPFLEDKWIVRRAAEGRLQPALIHKRKKGFPLYGHKNVRVRPGFFRHGYVESLVGLSLRGEDYMLRTSDAYFVAKLVSVEVFGRLFAFQQQCDDVTEHLLKYVYLELN